MGSLGGFRPVDDWRRLRAWERHYLAKGCSRWKAAELRQKKRYKSTWPPTGLQL